MPIGYHPGDSNFNIATHTHRPAISPNFRLADNRMHVRMSRMAASLTSTRYSHVDGPRSARPESVAASRLDHRATRESLLVRALGADGSDAPIEALNEKALAVMARVQDKLSGEDFGPRLDVADQVDRLILQATDVQNLCQSFVGWCPFW